MKYLHQEVFNNPFVIKKASDLGTDLGNISAYVWQKESNTWCQHGSLNKKYEKQMNIRNSQKEK